VSQPGHTADTTPVPSQGLTFGNGLGGRSGIDAAQLITTPILGQLPAMPAQNSNGYDPDWSTPDLNQDWPGAVALDSNPAWSNPAATPDGYRPDWSTVSLTPPQPGAGLSLGGPPGPTGADNPRTVHSLTTGKVTTAGWQNPGDQNSGLGWRVWITDDQGNRTGYGHMDPSSTPPVGTIIKEGDNLGVYANPTNGSSTAPHVHVQAYDHNGNPMDPGGISPLTKGIITTPYGGRDGISLKMGHNGVDWAAPR
jgi:hypothetical protein